MMQSQPQKRAVLRDSTWKRTRRRASFFGMANRSESLAEKSRSSERDLDADLAKASRSSERQAEAEFRRAFGRFGGQAKVQRAFLSGNKRRVRAGSAALFGEQANQFGGQPNLRGRQRHGGFQAGWRNCGRLRMITGATVSPGRSMVFGTSAGIGPPALRSRWTNTTARQDTESF